jgi:hypothetical protein
MYEIGQLTASLFSDTPSGLLYHYTTLAGLQGIVSSRALWASDIRYMNDSAELKHTADLIRLEVQERISRGKGQVDLLDRFADWVSHRISSGHLLFAASFRSQGNLLSQWRGYSSHGRGVSLGFPAEYILDCARRQQFQIGKCIYEPTRQRKLIGQIVDAVQAQGRQVINEDSHTRHGALYQEIFARIEIDLLRIATIIKHPSFREEREWRIVSPVFTEILSSLPMPVRFREAHAMLVPYIEFDLRGGDVQLPVLDHLYLGPTQHINLSMNSLKMFLAQHGITPARGIDYCQIPYRQR